jgi:hypothetical protein
MCWLGIFWKLYIGEAVGGKWDMTDLIGVAEERAANQLEMIL